MVTTLGVAQITALLLQACSGGSVTMSHSTAPAASAAPGASAAAADAGRAALQSVAITIPAPSAGIPDTAFSSFESAHVHPLDITPDGTRLLAVNTPNNDVEIFTISGNSLTLESVVKVGVEFGDRGGHRCKQPDSLSADAQRRFHPGADGYVFAGRRSYDPTPSDVRNGRPLLYNTQQFSGLGQIACGSCHVDARTDRLAWDLGDPTSAAETIGNVTLGKTASAAEVGCGSTAAAAVDGNVDGNFFHGSVVDTYGNNPQDYWEVDLGAVATIQSVNLSNRTDCCATRLNNFYVLVSQTSMDGQSLAQLLANPAVTRVYTANTGFVMGNSPQLYSVNVGDAEGRYVRVQLAGTNQLALAEVQVMGWPAGAS
jgi:hypothetical protein